MKKNENYNYCVLTGDGHMIPGLCWESPFDRKPVCSICLLVFVAHILLDGGFALPKRTSGT